MRWCAIFWVAALVACLSANVRAEEADKQAARSAFRRGIALAEQDEWTEAIEAFEASLDAVDRPATRVNLVLAYNRTEAPLEVMRHGLAFVRMADAPRHEEARDRVERLMGKARQALGRLCLVEQRDDERDPTVDSEASCDADANRSLRVDGKPPRVVDETGTVYVTPGHYSVQVPRDGRPPFETEVELAAGKLRRIHMPVPKSSGTEASSSVKPSKDHAEHAAETRQQGVRTSKSTAKRDANSVVREGDEPERQDATRSAVRAGRNSSGASAAQEEERSRGLERSSDTDAGASGWRRKMAHALGWTGLILELSAVGVLATAVVRQRELANVDPFQSGFLSEALRFRRLRNSVAPLALMGGVLAAGSVALAPGIQELGRRRWAWGAIGMATTLGAAGALVASHEPGRIGETRLTRAGREPGFVLLGVAVPWLSYGVVRLALGDDAPVTMDPFAIRGRF